MSAPRTYAPRRLVDLAWRLYGDNWQSPLSRLIDVPQRTLSRMFEAADDERDYPGADEALKAFAARLGEFTAEVKAEARKIR